VSKNKNEGEMSVRQAERILEIFENGSKNGEQWAHDVVLHRGTDKYQQSIDTLNEAFRLKSIQRVIKPLSKPQEPESRKDQKSNPAELRQR
jgi:hypothetical protein